MRIPSAVLFGSWLAFAACSASVGDEVRRHTYPSEARYIRRAEIKNAMEELVAGARGLDQILIRAPTENSATLQQDVLKHLHAMRTAVAAIDPGSARTNHESIDDNLASFIRELELAERSAESDPPSYFLAASISGSCMHCHGGDGVKTK